MAAKPPRRIPPHELPPEAQLVAKIEEVRKERARLTKLPNTATSVGQSHKLEAELLKELRDVRSHTATTPVNPAADLSDHDLITGICEAIAGWPDEALDRLESALLLRRTGRPQLKVVES